MSKLARARFARRHRISGKNRLAALFRTKSVLISSATAARPASAIPGPLDPGIEEGIVENDLIAASVLSGNRNFEARVHQNIKANFLMSPPLVVAFALAGTVDQRRLSRADRQRQRRQRRLSCATSGRRSKKSGSSRSRFRPGNLSRLYSEFAEQNPLWNEIPTSEGAFTNGTEIRLTFRSRRISKIFRWKPEIFRHQRRAPAGDFRRFGDDRPHFARRFDQAESPAGLYLQEQGVEPGNFNSYGSRRGNDRVMVRGTFANVRIKNLMVAPVEGGVTCQPDGEQMTIYDAAMKYQSAAGAARRFRRAGIRHGQSRDWAAKGTR
jgi:aconitate hydratase